VRPSIGVRLSLRKTPHSSAQGIREPARRRQRRAGGARFALPVTNAPRRHTVVALVAIDVRAFLGPFPAPAGAEGACTMLTAAKVPPPGPAEPEANVFPLRERLRFRDSFGLALIELRGRSLSFKRLAKGPWALFIAISVHWQGNAEAWPSQEALARFSGWSARAVRDQADVLERSGFIRVRRERRPSGSERIFYAPGLVTLAALADFVERFPRERAKPLRADTRTVVTPAMPPTSPHPAEAASAAPPEEASMEHRDQDQIEPSSCRELPPTPTTAPRTEEEQQIEISKQDEEIACRALAERMLRKHPTRPAPRWFDASDVAMVAACAAALESSEQAKMLALRDAIAGAFLVSKDGAPTVRFIWEKLEHFLDHVERGRRRRLSVEKAARCAAEPATGARSRALRTPAPAPMPEEVRAELERLFGPRWSASHVEP